MCAMKSLVYADSEATLTARMEALATEWGDFYRNFVDHASSLFERRHEWAMCLRDGVPHNGHHTNNLVEAAFRILKDSILHR